MISKIKAFFNSDRYHKVDQDDLVDKVKYNKPTGELFSSLSEQTKALDEAKNLEDIENDIKLNEATVYSDIDTMVDNLSQLLDADYQQNIEESKEAKWEFKYFLHQTELVEDALLVVMELNYPEPTDVGTVMYNVVAIKHSDNKYYVWDMR